MATEINNAFTTGTLDDVKISIIIFAVLAFLYLFTKSGGLKAVLVTSYCGVIIVSFTGGASWSTAI